MRKRQRFIQLSAWCTAAAAIIAPWVVQWTLHAEQSRPQSSNVVNPHWDSQHCDSCHKGQTAPYTALDPGDVDAMCVSCHDGISATREVHPVGRTFTSEQIVKPQGWPAHDGKLGCLTCHDVLLACDRDRQRPQANAAFLRDGPWRDQLQFCAQCHVVAAEATGGYTPHVMIDEQNQLHPRACRFCHTQTFPDRPLRHRTGQSHLRADELTLCVSCHREHIDWFDPGHMHQAVTQDMQEYMLKIERRVLDQRRIRLPATQPASRRPQLLPLTSKNRVTCSTCHNPHEQGVFPADSVLSLGAMELKKKDSRKLFRGLGKELCRGCHRM